MVYTKNKRRIEMKKICLVVALLCMVAGSAFARNTDASTERCQNVAERPVFGDLTLHRDLSAADTFTYGVNDGDRIDLSNCRRVVVYAKTTGSTTGWTLTPYFGDSTASTYFVGTTTTVTNDAAYILETYGCKQFIMRCAGITGTAPTCKIYIQKLD